MDDNTERNSMPWPSIHHRLNRFISAYWKRQSVAPPSPPPPLLLVGSSSCAVKHFNERHGHCWPMDDGSPFASADPGLVDGSIGSIHVNVSTGKWSIKDSIFCLSFHSAYCHSFINISVRVRLIHSLKRLFSLSNWFMSLLSCDFQSGVNGTLPSFADLWRRHHGIPADAVRVVQRQTVHGPLLHLGTLLAQ